MTHISLINVIQEKGKKYYVLAETAFSHEGDITYLYNQIDAAKNGGADGIKFQILLEKDSAFTPDSAIYPLLNVWMYTRDEWIKILSYAKAKNIEVGVTPIDIMALDFCVHYSSLVDFIEIHSINLNEKPFLDHLSKFNKPIILGVGGRTLEEIDYCISVLKKSDECEKDILLMHGFQSFPTNHKNIKMARINRLKCIYGLTIGYADHMSYEDNFFISLVEYAYLQGARVFEKHLVVNKGEKRTDYESAVGVDDFLTLRANLENLLEIIGEGEEWDFSQSEYVYRNREKKLVAIRDIKKGERLNEENIGFKVTAEKSALQQKDYEYLIGKTAGEDIKINGILPPKNHFEK